MEEINDAIQNIANVFDSNENRTAEGRNSNHGQNTESYSSDDESNKSRRQTDVLHLRYKHVKNRNMLT